MLLLYIEVICLYLLYVTLLLYLLMLLCLGYVCCVVGGALLCRFLSFFRPPTKI